MFFHIISIFPDSFNSYLDSSILKNARIKGIFDYSIYNLCDFSIKNTRRVDSRPYGGFPGTILSPEPLYNALNSIINNGGDPEVIYLTPRGERLEQHSLEKFAKTTKEYILICGHYEGIDERIIELFNIKMVSIGDYVLTSGELASMVLIDGIVRLIPGVLSTESLLEESFSESLGRNVEYPQYTRPSEFMGKLVPEELMSGDPKLIAAWKKSFYK